MTELFREHYDEDALRAIPTLTLAHVGDSVYELLARSAVTAAEADPTALLSRLGSVPFWRGVNRCQDSLTRIYTRVHAAAAPAAEGNSLSL